MEPKAAGAIINQLAYDIVVALHPTLPRQAVAADAAEIARLIRARLREHDFVRLERIDP